MKTFGKALLIIIVLELSLGGGGRWMDTAGLPRIILFCFGIGYSVLALLTPPSNGVGTSPEKIPHEFLFLMLLFIVLTLFSLSVSMLNGEGLWEAAKGLRPQMYFLLLPFFVLVMRNAGEVMIISKTLKFSALTLAISFLATMALWRSGLVTNAQIMGQLNPTGNPGLEFLFRGDTTFFFKAILYVGVGVFFFAVEKNWARKSPVLLLMLAIAFTMTRGVWLSVFIVLAAWAFFYTGNRLKGAVIAVTLLFIGAIGVIWINATLPTVEISNAIRMNDLKALKTSLFAMSPSIWNWQTILCGHGFSGTIFGRKAVENTYIYVLYRQGLPWLLFWLLPFVYLIRLIRTIRDPDHRILALPYFMAATFVYLVSFTNPFLSGAIGISVVMIAMVAVRTIAHSSKS